MKRNAPFFVGYLPVPRDLRLVLAISAIAFVLAFVIAAWAVGISQDNPGDGRFRFDLGRQTVTGVLEMRPYPVLHVIEGSKAIETGETLMLSGGGKFGVAPRVNQLDGMVVNAKGILLNRGTIRMLQIGNQRRDLTAGEGQPTVPEPVNLGRWRLAGEICDGKCLAGAMRPGRGIAHKACAELCIQGGVPPVFVTTQPVEGHEFMMLADADGGPIMEQLLEKVGIYVSLEGRVEQRGGIAVFIADPNSLAVLP